MNLALFDFDGTITDKDSFLLFLRYIAGRKFYPGLARLTPWLTAYLVGLYANDKLKERFLTTFLTGWSEDALTASAQAFRQSILPGIVRPRSLEQIARHQRQKDTIVLVSASPEPMLAPWCKEQNMELIGTRLEMKNGKTTGKIKGKNCWGNEKVRRILAAYDINEFEQIDAYGDSKGDLPMLELAHTSHYKPFT